MAFSRQVIFPDFNRKGDRKSPEGLSVTQGALVRPWSEFNVL